MNDLNDQQKPVAEGLPELCFTTLPSTGELICIKRGELGYYPSSWNTDDKQRNEELANYNNERLGLPQNSGKQWNLALWVAGIAPVPILPTTRTASSFRPNRTE